MTEELLKLIASHVGVLIIGFIVGHARGDIDSIYATKRIKAAAMIGYTFGVRDRAKNQVAKDVDEAIKLVETEMKQKGL